MSINKDLISIIIPAFNVDKYINKCLHSVLSQSHQVIEVLIINDGSTDKTETVIRSFKDPRIRYFHQNNCGVSASRNILLQQMRGDYFCFIDADDVMPPNSLQSRLSIFKKNADIEFVDGKVDYYNSDFTKKIKTWKANYHGNPLEDLLELSGNSFLGNTWMIRRRPDRTYIFSERLTHGEDLLFYISVVRNGGKYAYTNETVLNYRTGHQSAMRNLQGLEKSYKIIYKEIMSMKDIPMSLKARYYKKAKSIMFKSYLGNGQPIYALKAFLRNWNY